MFESFTTSQITGAIILTITLISILALKFFYKPETPINQFVKLLKKEGLTPYLSVNPKGTKQGAKAAYFITISGTSVTFFVFRSMGEAFVKNELNLYGHSAIQNCNLILLEKPSHKHWETIKQAFYRIKITETTENPLTPWNHIV